MVMLMINYNQETSMLAFMNISNVVMDLLVFMFYSDESEIDVETGIVK